MDVVVVIIAKRNMRYLYKGFAEPFTRTSPICVITDQLADQNNVSLFKK